ncbi:MAG TPA: xanthine dehydrogenase family protein molybdopterin-binding subunit [Candidatus Methylomirabilis sp.]|nr:xanthine dehydrogenase family protein molybdopterin-binding subunit [Candidatus Methylomirabilis sp.]
MTEEQRNSAKFVGDRLLRKEDPRLVQGQGRYVGDIALPGMLHAAVLRSPHAHARLGRVDSDRARCVPGVAAVVTFADLGEAARPLPVVPPHPALRARNFHALAGGRARFVGEAVAVVVADSRHAAEDARELVRIDYEPLPSVQDPADRASALVHEDIADNLAGRVTLSRGDVETVFRGAPRAARARLTIGRAGGQPMETRGLAAEYHAMAGLLTVWASSQVPHQVRQFICELLGLPPHRVRVIAPDVGGGFGAKLIVYPEDVLIPWLAMRLGRPVRWLEERAEHMLAATQERAQLHEVAVGFDDEGRLLALRDHFVHDTGAYTPRGLVVPLLTASMLTGPYVIPAVEVSFESVYTNRVPVTPYRGAGQPQAVFVIERVLDLVARETGRDRAAVRLANLVRPEAMPYDVGLANYRGAGNVIHDSGDYPAVLRRALEMADYPDIGGARAAARREGRSLGVGVACYVELTGVGPFEGATARVDGAGRIAVFTGVTSQGQGLETTLAQVAADELGVTPDDVTVINGDTLGIDHGIGTFASRAAVAGGSAVALAARDLRAKAVRIAARVLGVGEDEVQQDGPAFAPRGRPEHRVDLGRLASAAALASAAHGEEPGLSVTRYFQPPDIAYSSGAHVAVVEVDAGSGQVKLLGYFVCHDSGRLINPMVVEGQIEGAIALGIGGALLEEVRYDEHGQPLAGTFMDYAMPRSTDVPPIRIEHLETPSPLNPLGLKGVGESGTLPVSAVLASAIEDALSEHGVRVCRMPLPPRCLAALIGGRPAAPASSA